MKRLLFFGLGCLLMASSARAITIGWKLDAWNASWLQADRVDVYLVSSQNSSDSWSGSGTNWETEKGSNSSSFTIANNGNAVPHADTLKSYGLMMEDGKAWINVEVNNLLTSGNYYSLAFVVKAEGDSEKGHYALTQAKQYTGAGSSGFIDLSASGPVDKFQFFDANAWTAANALRGTPEPTVWALLALGMSGLALRRRVTR